MTDARPEPPGPDDRTRQAAVQNALNLFRRWGADPQAVVLDTETTALDGQVWEVGVTGLHTEQTLLHGVVRAGSAWSEHARSLHAGRLDEIGAAPAPETLRTRVGTALVGQRVLAYNATFDQAAVERTWPGLPLPTFACVMDAYAPLAGLWSAPRGVWKSVKLSEACAREQVDLGGLQAHTALDDARLTARLVRAVAARALKGVT